MKKDKKPNTSAVIDNYNFYDRQTDRLTYGHGDSMTDPAQRAKSVKTSKTEIVTKLKNLNCDNTQNLNIKL